MEKPKRKRKPKTISSISVLKWMIGIALMVIAACYGLMWFASLIIPAMYPDVGDEAIANTHAVMTRLHADPNDPLYAWMFDYVEDCMLLLTDQLSTHSGQYTTELIAAFDANDPDYAIEGTYPPIGNREAVVRVGFPSGKAVELYWYNGGLLRLSNACSMYTDSMLQLKDGALWSFRKSYTLHQTSGTLHSIQKTMGDALI